MPKRLGSADVIKVLVKHAFRFVVQKGSHAKFKNPAGRIVTVPQPKKRTSDWYHAVDYPAVRINSRGFRVLIGSPGRGGVGFGVYRGDFPSEVSAVSRFPSSRFYH